MFCSRECSFSWRAEEKELRETEERIIQVVKALLRTCKMCNTHLYTNTATKEFCSQRCCGAFNGRGNIYCPDCNTPVEVRKTYCGQCRENRKRTHRKQQKRLNHRDRGNHRKRAKKYGVKYEPITFKKLRKQKPRTTCSYCDRKLIFDNRDYNPLNATMDHIKPMANGGDHVVENLTICCSLCNSIKGDRPVEYLMSHEQFREYTGRV